MKTTTAALILAALLGGCRADAASFVYSPARQPSHCVNEADRRLPTGVCVHGPTYLHQQRDWASTRPRWRDAGYPYARGYFDRLDADKFGSAD